MEGSRFPFASADPCSRVRWMDMTKVGFLIFLGGECILSFGFRSVSQGKVG